jgi:hypothetical protein
MTAAAGLTHDQEGRIHPLVEGSTESRSTGHTYGNFGLRLVTSSGALRRPRTVGALGKANISPIRRETTGPTYSDTVQARCIMIRASHRHVWYATMKLESLAGGVDEGLNSADKLWDPTTAQSQKRAPTRQRMCQKKGFMTLNVLIWSTETYGAEAIWHFWADIGCWVEARRSGAGSSRRGTIETTDKPPARDAP